MKENGRQDEPLARIGADGTIRYYLADALGSIIALADENGIVKTRYNYSPFGITKETGEASDNSFKFTGREDDGTGLYYYRARYYSPEMGRFISEDPIGFEGGDVNWYAYVGNNSVNLIDPVGLFKWNGRAESRTGSYSRYGGGYINVTLTTFYGTNKMTAEYEIWVGGASIGTPVNLIDSDFVLDDSYASQAPDPCKMEGTVIIGSVSGGIGGENGYGLGVMLMGEGEAWNIGPAEGVGFSTDLFIGRSRLINVTVTDYTQDDYYK